MSAAPSSAGAAPFRRGFAPYSGPGTGSSGLAPHATAYGGRTVRAEPGTRGTGEAFPRAARFIAPGTAQRDVRVWDRLVGTTWQKLRAWGVVGFSQGRYEVGPEATLGDLLDAWEARGAAGAVPLADPGDFTIRNRVRVILRANDQPQPDWVLRAFLEVFGREAVRIKTVGSVLGHRCAHDSLRRLKAMAGIGGKERGALGHATEDDLMAVLPEAVRERLKAHLRQERVPAIPPLAPTSCWFLTRLGDGPIRVMGAMALIGGTAKRRSAKYRKRMVTCAERAQSLLGAVAGDAAATEEVIADYLANGRGTQDSELTRLLFAQAWFRDIRGATACARLALGPDAGMVVDLLPACRKPGEALAAAMAEAGARLLGNKPKERLPVVADVIARMMAVQAALENRVFQMEGLLSRCMAALPGARARLEAGLEAGFAWEEAPVVRFDGSLGRGTQTISFSFRTEGQLLEEAHGRDPGNWNLRARLPRRPGDTARYSGQLHRAENWGRVFVVWDGVTPSAPGGEAVEPFCVEFFRLGAFENDRLLPAGVRQARSALLRSMGLPPNAGIVEGILGVPKARRFVAGAARGADPAAGEIVVPLVEFYHAMAFARVVVRYGIRWGARFGEIMQLRLGCTGKHRKDGKWRAYLELKPKGWSDWGRFGIDPGTARAIAAVRAFTSARFHRGLVAADGGPGLPVVRVGDESREDLPDAAYLFQANGRALSPETLMRFVKVLLFGVVDLGAHDGRYVFATALGLNGIGYDELGGLLHHSPGSAMPRRYDLSAMIRSEAAAERFNESLDADALGSLADA